MRTRTQVGIIGAGPAGLLLSHLLALRGIESVLVESRSREYCEARQRAGVLEDGSVALLREAGLAARLDQQGLEHGGIYLQFGGERRHIDFRELTGHTVTVYAQTEVVKDLIARRIADDGAEAIQFGVTGTQVSGLDSARPVLGYTDAAGQPHQVECDVIAGCDGFHGICRHAIPPGVLPPGNGTTRSPGSGSSPTCRRRPTNSSTPATRSGFALHSLRSPAVSRLYLQVDPADDVANWPDEPHLGRAEPPVRARPAGHSSRAR